MLNINLILNLRIMHRALIKLLIQHIVDHYYRAQIDLLQFTQLISSRVTI